MFEGWLFNLYSPERVSRASVKCVFVGQRRGFAPVGRIVFSNAMLYGGGFIFFKLRLTLSLGNNNFCRPEFIVHLGQL